MSASSCSNCKKPLPANATKCPSCGRPVAQTFDMPSAPKPVPEKELAKVTGSSGSWATNIVIALFVMALIGLGGLYKLWWVPHIEGKKVAAEIAAAEQARLEALVAPWPERATKGLKKTFSGEGAAAMAKGAMEACDQEGKDAAMGKLDIVATESSLIVTVPVSFKDKKDEPKAVVIQWTFTEEAHVEAKVVSGEASEEAVERVETLFAKTAYTFVKGNTPEK